VSRLLKKVLVLRNSLQVAIGSLLISFVVLALKMAAYWLTGSVALYSDALETTINVAGAAAALFAIWYAGRPADQNHPYGHHKVEYFSAIVEGGMVVATAVLIGEIAWEGWQHPRAPDAPYLGIAVNAVAGVINLGWALLLMNRGRRWKSPALVAGGKHIMTDVWTTLGVLAAVALVPVTGWLRLDAVVAGCVALNIVWAGYGMLRESVAGLMDEVTDPEQLRVIRAAIAAHADGALEAHDLRTRTAGRLTFVEFHLVVPAKMSVEDAHVICDQIEAAIRRAMGEAIIHIHVEPEGKAKHKGVLVLG
jgi:cation diffusion facilitator family transporter